MAYVLLETKGHVGIVTISRPKALNALNADVLNDLSNVFTQVAKDDNIYVVVLTGEGRSFVAGADISAMRDMTAVEGQEFAALANSTFLQIENLAKPVIAAVNGFALGGGCELSMACDMRIASEKALIGQPEVGLGITPGFGGTQRMPRIIGYGKAMELILSTRKVKADEAYAIGLVDKVVPHDQLMDEAMKLAESIAVMPQVAVRQAKLCIRKGMQADINTALAFESEAFGLCFSTEDKHESMSAFLEKREAKNFKNR
ncbi:MAG: enoyl-CoA hydratase-related protein [Oscillospiraceae bacterium]|nr:enoyl-CoA hydratase-related protein [Oscillospiraceae bacterium]